jgi:AcrR family transcriptional regulator
MGRPARYELPAIIAAARSIAAEHGPGAVSMTGVAEALGAPSGSLYHRLTGREHLMALVWLDAVEHFHHSFLPVLRHPDSRTAVERGATAVVRWARDHPARAAVLTQMRRTDLLSDRWPPEVRERAERAGKALATAFDQLARRSRQTTSTDRRRLEFLLVDGPYGVIRRAHDAGRPLSRGDERLVAEAARALFDS